MPEKLPKNIKQFEQYTHIEHIGSISKPNNGWTKELNFVSWGNRELEKIR